MKANNVATSSLEPAYAALGLIGQHYLLAVSARGKISTRIILPSRVFDIRTAIDFLRTYLLSQNLKIVALAITNLIDADKFGEALWLELDIVPHIFKNKVVKNAEDLKVLCYKVMSTYDLGHKVKVQMAARRQIVPSYLTTLDAYKDFATPEEFNNILDLAQRFKQRKLKMIFINATGAGGGVAHMRHAMMRLYRLLGIAVDWHVLIPDEEVFKITKMKFHNVLQAVAAHGQILTPKENEVYKAWTKKNAELFRPIIKQSSVVVIDDPQPAGLIPFVREINPQAKILYRSHIQIKADMIDKRIAQQFTTWKFLWQFIKLADRFISHPVLDFVPKSIKRNKLILMPPSTDPLDGLNKPLCDWQTDYYLEKFQEYLKASGQAPLDRKRPYLIQIARFDPSKGIPDVIESYRKLCRRLLKANIMPAKMPQLVIVGNGSVDDPEGSTIYEETRQTLKLDTYAHIVKDIKVARLPHGDQVLNALLSECLVALQLSHKEGFEFKVSEALMKGRPVIAYKVGGIPLQIRHGQSGFLVKVGETSQVADYALKLFLDKKYYDKISSYAKVNVNHDYWTMNNCAQWLDLALKI